MRQGQLPQIKRRCVMEDDNDPPCGATLFPGSEVTIMHYRSKPGRPANEMCHFEHGS